MDIEGKMITVEELSKTVDHVKQPFWMFSPKHNTFHFIDGMDIKPKTVTFHYEDLSRSNVNEIFNSYRLPMDTNVIIIMNDDYKGPRTFTEINNN